MLHWFPGFGATGVLLALILSGCSVAGSRPAAGKGGLPAIKQDCGLCHPSHDGKVTGLLAKPVSELCLGCHQERAGNREHVVDIVPSMAVTGLPLRDGKITCATCHDPHGNRFGSMLRLPAGKLCRACHKK